MPKREFADGNAEAGVDVGVGPVLDCPSGSGEHAVNGLAGLFFRRQSWLKALAHQCMTTRKDACEARCLNLTISRQRLGSREEAPLVRCFSHGQHFRRRTAGMGAGGRLVTRFRIT